MVGVDATVYVPDICAHKPGIYRCISSLRDRLGVYAEIQIIFGTVCILYLSLWWT